LDNKLLYIIISAGIFVLCYVGVYAELDIANRKMMIEGTSQTLAHPFTLLLTGTVISSILIPKFAQKSQDRKKRIEIQINLEKEISKAVTKGIGVAISITNKINTVKEQEECALLFKQIEVDLWAYFQNADLADKWGIYFDYMAGLWTLTKHLWDGNFNDQKDKEYIEAIQDFHSEIGSERKIDWDKLQTKDYREDFDKLKILLFNHYRTFVIKVHQSQIAAF
jgi:hypothetical protein